jgi:hypothetical protein
VTNNHERALQSSAKVAIMSTFINYYKVVKGEAGNNELKWVELAGIAQDGIVLDAGKLNNELSETIQALIYREVLTKYTNTHTTVEKYRNSDNVDVDRLLELEKLEKDYINQLGLLENYTTGELSKYTFVNRLAVAILNCKTYRITYENPLMDCLRIVGTGDNAQFTDLSGTRKVVIETMAKMLEIKDCPYVKPINIKLNLKEVAQLVSIANNTRARWTNKGIKVRQSKSIATETAIQCILFVCKNCFKMVVPVKASKDDRQTI